MFKWKNFSAQNSHLYEIRYVINLGNDLSFLYRAINLNFLPVIAEDPPVVIEDKLFNGMSTVECMTPSRTDCPIHVCSFQRGVSISKLRTINR